MLIAKHKPFSQVNKLHLGMYESYLYNRVILKEVWNRKFPVNKTM